MNELLHPDNPIIRFLTRLFDLMLLNLLFIISCIPIVTIGAAISATYHVIFKIIDKKDPYIVKSYFKAMKENFKHATLLWILILSAGICINTALFFIYNIPDKKFEFLQIPICLFIFILLSVAVYAFPLLSRYQCSMKQLLKNTMILSFTNIPATVIIGLQPAVFSSRLAVRELCTLLHLFFFEYLKNMKMANSNSCMDGASSLHIC